MATSEARLKPNLLITGTPGTGKSTLCEELAERLGFDYINCGKEVLQHGLFTEFDQEFNSHVLDEDKLLDHIEERMDSVEGGVIIDYHGADFFPQRWFDFVFVLRCNNTLLFDRLKARGYSDNKIRENVECEIFGSLLEEAKESYEENIVHELMSETPEQMMTNIEGICGLVTSWTTALVALPITGMCRMWEKIRFGVKWRPKMRVGLAARGIDLKTVDSIQISMDPFHPGNESIRWFWSIVTSRHVQRTNPRTKIECDLRNDRMPPYFCAKINSGQKLLFKTDGMHAMDLMMTFNRLLGNPEFGKSGIRPLPKIE